MEVAVDNQSSATEPTCRQITRGMGPTPYRKDGQPRVVNKHPTTCVVCGDKLAPGEAIVGSKDKETGQTRWMCGAGRFLRT